MAKKHKSKSRRPERPRSVESIEQKRIRLFDQKRQDHLKKLIEGAESWMDPNISEDQAKELLHGLSTEELSYSGGNAVHDECVLHLKQLVASLAAEARSQPGTAKGHLTRVAQALIDACHQQQGMGIAAYALMKNSQLYSEWRNVKDDATATPVLVNLRKIFTDPKNDPALDRDLSDWTKVKGQILTVLDKPGFSPCDRLQTIAGLLESDARGEVGATQIDWNHPVDGDGMRAVPIEDFVKMIDGIRDDDHAQLMLQELVGDAIKAKHNEGIGQDEGVFTGFRKERDQLLSIVMDEGLTKLQRLRLAKPILQDMIPATEKRIASLTQEISVRKGNLERNKALAQLVQQIDQVQDAGLALQSNDCSRLHKVMEAAKTGRLVGVRHGEEAVTTEVTITDNYIPFVVKHNWAAVLGDSEGDTSGEAMLPAPNAAFEFRISGLNVVVLARDVPRQEDAEVAADRMVLIEGPEDWWVIINATAWPIYKFALAQVHAACVVMEAQVATYVLTQASPALNKKRLKAGKLPLYDFHTIDLNRKAKARTSDRSAASEEPSHHKRLHFCRSHNRTYQNGRTIRVPWCLKGDPNLGFVDKQYIL